MRIIAGEFGGRPLKTLKGDATRPTTDRVREALMSRLFSVLGSFEGVRVLDAFAGTGALGFETLSRGAAHVVFCDQNREAQRVVQANASSLGIGAARWTLRKGDVFSLPTTAQQPFDLVFLDPPYAYDAKRVAAFVSELDEAGMLSEGAVVCYEYAKKDKQNVLEVCDALEYLIVSTKDYGDTSITIFRKVTR